VLCRLKDWSQRSGRQHSAQGVADRANQQFAKIKDATIFALVPPPITELSMSSDLISS